MGNTSINIIKGKEKIILSAPYSVLHMRENSIRPRETRTGTIVLTLHLEQLIKIVYPLILLTIVRFQLFN